MKKVKNSPKRLLEVSVLLLTSLLASCAPGHVLASSNFVAHVKGEGDVRLTGWLQLRGEIMLFNNRQAMRTKLRYPYCISGVLKDQAVQNLAQFDGKRVSVTGRLFRFGSLDNEDTNILQRKVLAGSVIPNFCFGDNVLLISHIERGG